MPSSSKDQQPHGNRNPNRNPDASWLYIRYTDDGSDTGDRPLAPGTRTWTSPDIFFSPVDKYGNVQTGVPTTVKARIFNDGSMDANGVYVEFWWFNPSLAFTSPPSSQRIGTFILNISGHSYADVVCPVKWIPGFVNSGHECLVVQCSCPSEGKDDLKYPYDAFRDRHVAQHNLMVSPLPSLPLIKLSVVNPFRMAGTFTLRVQTLLVNARMDESQAHTIRAYMVRLANAAVSGNRTDPGHKNIPPEVRDVSQHEFGIRIAGTRKIRSATQKTLEYPRQILPPGEDLDRYIQTRASLNPDFNPETLGRVLTGLFLEPGEAREVDIDLPPINVRSDSYLVHHFTQVVAGCDIGGYTVIVPPHGG